MLQLPSTVDMNAPPMCPCSWVRHWSRPHYNLLLLSHRRVVVGSLQPRFHTWKPLYFSPALVEWTPSAKRSAPFHTPRRLPRDRVRRTSHDSGEGRHWNFLLTLSILVRTGNMSGTALTELNPGRPWDVTDRPLGSKRLPSGCDCRVPAGEYSGQLCGASVRLLGHPGPF